MLFHVLWCVCVCAYVFSSVELFFCNKMPVGHVAATADGPEVYGWHAGGPKGELIRAKAFEQPRQAKLAESMLLVRVTAEQLTAPEMVKDPDMPHRTTTRNAAQGRRGAAGAHVCGSNCPMTPLLPTAPACDQCPFETIPSNGCRTFAYRGVCVTPKCPFDHLEAIWASGSWQLICWGRTGMRRFLCSVAFLSTYAAGEPRRLRLAELREADNARGAGKKELRASREADLERLAERRNALLNLEMRCTMLASSKEFLDKVEDNKGDYDMLDRLRADRPQPRRQ